MTLADKEFQSLAVQGNKWLVETSLKYLGITKDKYQKNPFTSHKKKDKNK